MEETDTKKRSISFWQGGKKWLREGFLEKMVLTFSLDGWRRVIQEKEGKDQVFPVEGKSRQMYSEENMVYARNGKNLSVIRDVKALGWI